MRGVHSAVDDIRRGVFTEVDRLAYAGDDLSADTWDSRGWDRQHTVRRNLLETALDLVTYF